MPGAVTAACRRCRDPARTRRYHRGVIIGGVTRHSRGESITSSFALGDHETVATGDPPSRARSTSPLRPGGGPPPQPAWDVTTTRAPQASMRARNALLENPANTTAWTAPIRAQPSMAMGNSGTIGRYSTTLSPAPTPRSFSTLAKRVVASSSRHRSASRRHHLRRRRRGHGVPRVRPPHAGRCSSGSVQPGQRTRQRTRGSQRRAEVVLDDPLPRLLPVQGSGRASLQNAAGWSSERSSQLLVGEPARQCSRGRASSRDRDSRRRAGAAVSPDVCSWSRFSPHDPRALEAQVRVGVENPL